MPANPPLPDVLLAAALFDAGQGDVERPGDFAGIPAAVSRLALRLRHAELAQEAQP